VLFLTYRIVDCIHFFLLKGIFKLYRSKLVKERTTECSPKKGEKIMSNSTNCNACGHELRFWLLADIEQVPTQYIWEAYCPHCKKEQSTLLAAQCAAEAEEILREYNLQPNC
jgi:hypothetical protein